MLKSFGAMLKWVDRLMRVLGYATILGIIIPDGVRAVSPAYRIATALDVASVLFPFMLIVFMVVATYHVGLSLRDSMARRRARALSERIWDDKGGMFVHRAVGHTAPTAGIRYQLAARSAFDYRSPELFEARCWNADHRKEMNHVRADGHEPGISCPECAETYSDQQWDIVRNHARNAFVAEIREKYAPS